MEDDLKILKVEYLSNHWLDFPQILHLSSGDQTKFKNTQMKTTSNGRQPQNIKSGISQQPLIGSFSNLKLKLRRPNQSQKCLKQRRPPMEDDLKILKVEYLRNHWSDLSQIWNLSSGDYTKSKILEMKTTSNRRRPQNIRSWISQQPLVGSSSSFKLRLRGQN